MLLVVQVEVIVNVVVMQVKMVAVVVVSVKKVLGIGYT